MRNDDLLILVPAIIRAAGPTFRTAFLKELDRQHDYSGSCGDGNFERWVRQQWNDKIDNLMSEVRCLV